MHGTHNNNVIDKFVKLDALTHSIRCVTNPIWWEHMEAS